MPPIFFSLGYLLAVIAFCATWTYAIALAHVHLFRPIDGSPLNIAALASLGAVSLLGSACFVKLTAAVRGNTAAYIGRAACASSAFVWALILIGGREVAAMIGPAALFLIFGGVAALHCTLGRVEGGRNFTAMATLALLVISAAALLYGLPHFVGMTVCCALLSYRVLRLWRTRTAPVGGNLRELFIMVSLVAVSVGLPLSVLRTAHPLYSRHAIVLPLDQWAGSMRVNLRYFDVWLEYPKSRLSEEQKAWFSTHHIDGHFYATLGADLRPRVVVDDARERRLETPLVVVSDTREWLGECLDKVLAGVGNESVILLDKAAAAKLGRLGARIVVDVPNLERVKK